jgi:hypothetical protein
LQRPRVVPRIGQGVATGVAQHVWEDSEGHTGAPAEYRKTQAQRFALPNAHPPRQDDQPDAQPTKQSSRLRRAWRWMRAAG